MKKTFFFWAILSLLSAQFAYAQSTDRFIRIVGNAKKEYKASKAALTFTVSEVQPNEYRQIKYKPVEMVFQELSTALSKMGYRPADLTKDNAAAFSSGFQSVRTERYRLILKDLSTLSEVSAVGVEGVKVGDFKYIFDEPGYSAEEEMALNAVKDAERKAKKLALEIGKKVGKILNIEDKSSGCCREIQENGKPEIFHTYKVNVTFELLD
jgi:uncharacterized protein YggE